METLKISLLLLVILPFSLSAQNFYQKELDDFKNEEKQEKVYLHFDKLQYAVGDNVWFKAYVTNATSHLPTEVSWNLYVELINSRKVILDSLTLLIENGTTHGNFSLNRNLPSGSYCIRAYTSWMQNSDPDYFFKKDFKIVNLYSGEKLDSLAENAATQRKILVDFLPEGGDLIDGIPAKVAIKASNLQGKGISVKGKIINDKGNEVTIFESNEYGYGLCFFKPKANESYSALIEGNAFQLPKVKNNGAIIRVTNSSKSDKVHVAVLSKNVDLKDGTLVVHRRGEFLLGQKCTKTNTMAVVIKKSDLGNGIIHITFFDKNKIPLSERLIYPNPPTGKSDITIVPDKEVYAKRSKITLEIGSISDTVHSASITINPQAESIKNLMKTLRTTCCSAQT